MQQPEILRCSLSFALLHLLASGQDDPFEFSYMSPPDPEGSKGRRRSNVRQQRRILNVFLDSTVINALLELRSLGAVDESRRITKTGRDMAVLPVEPKLARILLASFALGCPFEVVSLVALLGYADTLMAAPASEREQAAEVQAKFVHRDGDHLTLLNMVRAYDALENKAERKAWCRENYINARAMANALEARKQLRQRCERMKLNWQQSCGDEIEPILQACLTGFIQNTAVLCPDGTYRRLLGSTVSRLFPQC